jgi:hypothetical protein
MKIADEVLDSSEKFGSINPKYATTYLCSFLTAMLFYPLAYDALLVADANFMHLVL